MIFDDSDRLAEIVAPLSSLQADSQWDETRKKNANWVAKVGSSKLKRLCKAIVMQTSMGKMESKE